MRALRIAVGIQGLVIVVLAVCLSLLAVRQVQDGQRLFEWATYWNQRIQQEKQQHSLKD
jgi:hypothetical protein